MSTVSARTPLTAVIVSLLLTGCAYRSEYHAAGAPYRSIKDDPEPRAVERHAAVPQGIAIAHSKPQPKLHASATPRITPTADKAPAHKIHAVPAPAPVNEPLKPLAPRATKSAAISPAPAPTPTIAPPSAAPPAAPAMTPPPASPSRSPDPVPAATPAATPAPPPAPVTQSPPASPQRTEPERATVDIRRGGPAISSTPPAAAPAPATPAAPAAAIEPPPAKPAAPAIIIQPKSPAAQVDTPAQPKVAALTNDQRIRDTIARAREYMAGGRIINARSLLQDAARDNNPLLLTALAETFDPLQLRDHFPSLARSAEPPRALEYYRRASESGSAAAAQKLKSLAEFLAANPGFLKQ